ncbi:Alpha-tectorin [Dissostichus eleginoides]|uniref:Alpha-tectorin n=1 Tax=Dissostichus eleginoides TaxID=100907 RepID=A0AAD9B0T9_DISEL|nr:Alpha-tectorin [Dissostichus eleginoides]
MELSASSVNLNAPGGHINISNVPITFYGKTYTMLHVKMGNKVEVCFKNDPSEEDIDCMVTSEGVASDILIYTIKEVSIPPAPSVANINTDGMGYIDLKFNTGYSNDMIWEFYNYGLQAACLTSHASGQPFSASLELSTKVGGTVMATWKDPKDIFFYRDLSGCRGSGGAVMPVQRCPEQILSNTACGPEEVCQADNTCAIPPVVCTVTGSTVIGFHGAVHSVQDRCTYSLMEPEGSASFNLMAAFRERRRTDVPLLDHLILSLPGVTMYLEQGGRVRVRKSRAQALVLSSTAQQHHGVELSKDQAGVTAKLPNSNMTLYFDGSTAHVSGTEHVSDPRTPGYPLVCLTSAVSNDMVLFLQTPPDPRTPGYPLVCLISAVSNDMVLFLQTPGPPRTPPTPGCEIQQQDTIDSSINCTSSTDQMEPSARNNSQIVYKNSIMSSNSSSGGVIIRSDQIQIDFSCKYTQPERRRPPAAGRPEHGDPAEPEGLAAAGGGGLDANMVAMVTDSCWATNQASPDDSLRYDLIINGCPNPADDTVQMQGNGQGTSSVSPSTCLSSLEEAVKSTCTANWSCAPHRARPALRTSKKTSVSVGKKLWGGARRRRRSARFAEGNAALITMAWTH